MAKVHVCQLSEVIPSLPEIQPFNALHNRRDERAALFFCALGFEPRCLTLPDALARSGFKAARAVYFEYNTNRHDNEVNRPQLLQHLGLISDFVQTLQADDQAFSRHLRELLESTTRAEAGQKPLVVFDLSVAANRLLMRCMKVFFEFDIRLQIYYSEAATYHPTLAEYRQDPSKWGAEESLGLERGVSSVTVSEEYSGYHIDQIPDCVILFPSFKKERSRAVIDEIDPSLLTVPGNNVLWLLGRPHLTQDCWRMDAMREINALGPDVPQYEVGTFDYKDTLEKLEIIYQERVGQYKFTLSPVGSKMQALGSALFCYLRPDVRVVFATPKEYNATRYSEGCKATWIIDLGSLREICKLIDQIGRARIEE